MHNDGKRLLNLMFKLGERICVSHNKYGYFSIPIEEVLNSPIVTLVSTPESCQKRNIEWKEENFEKVNTDQLLLVALNPISEWREDEYCTSFRNFLVEMDCADLKSQVEYIKKIGMPYSACIFSGNKSLHYLISLENDLPSEKEWRFFAEWILKSVTLADPLTKNPSRSIRIPGAYREPGKKQRLVDLKGPINIRNLTAWLSNHIDAKPKIQTKKVVNIDGYDFTKLAPWVQHQFAIKSIDFSKGRNKTWFALAVELFKAGYEEDGIVDILDNYFSEERDFKRKEWLITIKSGVKYAINKYENGY